MIMNDPNLFESSKNSSSVVQSSKNKDRFDLALEESIKECVNHLMKDEDPTKNYLTSPAIRRKKLEMEVSESLDLTEFGQNVSNAVNIIREDGKLYLSIEEYDALIKSLDNLRSQLDNLDLNNLEDGSFKN